MRKIDKTFDQEHFVKFLEKEMIPIVLEAKAINDTEVIEVNHVHLTHSAVHLCQNSKFSKMLAKQAVFWQYNLYCQNTACYII